MAEETRGYLSQDPLKTHANRLKTLTHPAKPMSYSGSSESLSILMPAYNEAATIVTALKRLWSVQLPIPCEIIVIDDASSDGSARLVAEVQAESPCPLRLLQHDRNRGKAAALRTGLEFATGTLTLIYDADLEYDPADIPALLAPVLDGRADAVYGSRFLSPERRVLFFWHALGNRLLTALANMFANLNLTDMETCFKLIRTEVLRCMRLRSERFGFEPEVTVKLGRLGLRVYEVPIRYSGRSYEEGKKIGLWDAVRAVGTIVRAGLFESPAATPEARTRYALGRLGPYYAEILLRVDWAIGDTILELSPGEGELAQHLVQRRRVILTDPNEDVVSRLRTRFSHRPNVVVQRWDPSSRETDTPEEFDTALCFHGLERMGEATTTLTALAARLRPDGHIVLLLPAHAGLYGSLDRGLGRRSRHTRAQAQQLVQDANLTVEWLCPVNALGAVGWWIATKLFRSSYMRPLHVRLFRLTMPLFRLERWIRPPFGLSYLIVARAK